MSFLLAILALGVLILVHEFGHFIMAKAFGVYVESFSIGFGPRIFSYKAKETEYCLSAIPLGGYVKMYKMFEGDDEDQAPLEKGNKPLIDIPESRAFYTKPVYQKLIIIVAGVFFNFIFAILLFSASNMVGYKTYSSTVGSVRADSPGYLEGILPGDKIIKIDGMSINTWQEFESALKIGETFNLELMRNDHIVKVTLEPSIAVVKNLLGDDVEIADTGLMLLIKPAIGTVATGSAAEKAGLLKNDVITSIQGIAIKQWSDIGAVVRNYPNEQINIKVLRGDKTVTLDATPALGGEGVGILGIGPLDGDTFVRYGLFKSLKLGTEQTFGASLLLYNGLWKMVRGKVSKDDIGGPVLIVSEMAKSAAEGFNYYLRIVAFISINLAVLNLLPIPVLDGGYVMMYLYEGITRRRVSMSFRVNAQKIGLSLLLFLMVFALYNDITRFFR